MEANLAARFPKLDVQIRAAHLASDGIEVRGLSISEPGAVGPRGELAYFDVLFLTCSTSPQELLSGEPAITEIKIMRPVLRATRRPDGTLSLNKLLPLPEPPWPPPTTTVENGTLEIFDPLKNPSSMFVLRDINMTLGPTSDCTPEVPKLTAKGYLVADQIHRLEMTATIEPKQGKWSASGSINGLDICPELRNALPGPVAARLERLASLRAPASMRFEVARQGEGELQFSIDGSVARGRIEDPLLPYPLTDVRGDFHCDNGGFTISHLTARDGPTYWEIDRFEQRGYETDSPFVLKARGRQVHLDAKWASTLPDPWRKYWHYYDPAGDINLDCTLVFDGQQYIPTLDATFLDNVSYSFHKFPYRLERSSGKLSMRHNVLWVALTGHAGAQPVSINGSFLNPGPQFTGSIKVQADKIPLDDKVFAAVLKPQSREALVSLNPSGTFNVYSEMRRDDPNIPGMKQYVCVTLDRSNRCAIAYDKFAYALSNLEGRLELNNGVWMFKDLKGTHGPGLVTLTGHVTTLSDRVVMEVSIGAQSIPLEEELRNALQPRLRNLWDSLQPDGKVDATAVVHFDSASRRTSVSLQAYPRDDSTSLGTSIEPVSFPYRMRLLGGRIDYHDGHVELHKIHAVHGATRLHTAGSCDIWPDGSWQLRLRDMTVDQLRLQGDDPELVVALPSALRRAVTELKPGGSLNLKGSVDFAKQRPELPLSTSWNIDLMMHQGHLQAGPVLENVFGRMRLRGTSNGSQFTSQGELELDSLTYKNFQFTHVAGPLWFDNANVYLGRWGPPTDQAAAAREPVTAELLGGSVSGDCHVRLGTVPQYHLAASMAQADLAQFAHQNLPGGQELRGKIAAEVELFGTSGQRNLSGRGTVHLSQADVYELPLMISLLKIARAKVPDSTAFTQSDIDFEIQQGEHIILRKIYLDGDAISLSGQGELTLDGNTNPIRLRLHASGGRGGLPLLSGVLNSASQQILLIHVGGTLEHPDTRTEPFPVANQALQQLQPDPAEPPLFPQAGALMRGLGLQR